MNSPEANSGDVCDASSEPFPRSRDLPKQSPLFWVAEKDRYLRQLLIRDIVATTGRTLLVYFAANDFRAQITTGDDVYFSEMLQDAKGGPVDLVIETIGGATDATEKIASVVRALSNDIRIIVPCRAKSNGTMLALIGREIVMGPCSELGPADPHLPLQGNLISANFLYGTPGVDPIIQQIAQHAIRQTQALAKDLLSTGMLRGSDPVVIDEIVRSLSTRDQYPSHGSVINAAEAERLGLKLLRLKEDDDLWGRLWLLRCMYDHDAATAGVMKIFEGPQVSNRIRFPVA